MLTVTLGSDSHLFKDLQLVRAYVRGRPAGSALVAPQGTAKLHVPLRRGPHGACTVRFTMAQTRVPARVEPGSTDTRHLGARFLSFSVS
jgi:hypothetical protein